VSFVLGLRPASEADREFCFGLHRAAMGPYVERLWGWDDTVQRGYHDRGFDPDRTRIITADGHDVGSLTVDHRADEIYLGRIQVHPDHQGRGIGARLIRDLLDEAAARGVPVTLDVLDVNRRAHALYRRLGFRDEARHGDDPVKVRMRADP
jgi:ribosomal protein S18 acetylase RimI-like enzyme